MASPLAGSRLPGATPCHLCCAGVTRFQIRVLIRDGGRAIRMLLGGTLSQVLERETSLPQPALRAVARRVLLGLRNMRVSARLHHANVKPANIGLLRSGDFESTVLIDFGSALPLGAAQVVPTDTDFAKLVLASF